MSKNYIYEEICALTLEDVKGMGAECMVIKEHDCYFVNLGEYFGDSVLVFKNGRHIIYADDFQLHHRSRNCEGELRKYYIEHLNLTLFTEEELLSGLSSYKEFRDKLNYTMVAGKAHHFSGGMKGDPVKEFSKKKFYFPLAFQTYV